MVSDERDLKRSGVTDIGTIGLTKAQAGADYRLRGRISSLDAYDRKSGISQRYNQITFELIDLESSSIVWTNMYEFSKAGSDDAVYR
jgi:PBP1b-binding outer membrane lipoprotein LpoB